jgi:hypothetical protein
VYVLAARSSFVKIKFLSIFGLVLVAMAFTTGHLVGRAGAVGIPAKSAMTYTGLLTEADGVTLLTGKVNIKIALWDAESSGTQKCSENSDLVDLTASAGSFRVALAEDCVQAVHDNADLWVEVTVGGTPLSRTKLGVVPYAVEANWASQAAGPLAEQVNSKLNREGETPVFSCPKSTTRLGAHCIDNVRREAASLGDAISSCHQTGMDLCSLSEIFSCDNLQPTTSQCTGDTDNATMVLWTSTLDPVGASIERIVSYSGSNTIAIEAISIKHPYYCCVAAGAMVR